MKKNHKKVPKYAKLDISRPEWRNGSGGIVALKILMDCLKSDPPGLDELIVEGIGFKAYDRTRGWKHDGLAKIARQHGLFAAPYDWSKQGPESAFQRLREAIEKVPCLASVHRNFELENKSHIVVIVKITKHWVYYQKPNPEKRKQARRNISIPRFLLGWERRGVIVKR